METPKSSDQSQQGRGKLRRVPTRLPRPIQNVSSLSSDNIAELLPQERENDPEGFTAQSEFKSTEVGRNAESIEIKCRNEIYGRLSSNLNTARRSLTPVLP